MTEHEIKNETRPILHCKKKDEPFKGVHCKEGLSPFNTGVMLVAEMVGAGVLVFPRALANTGWGGVLMIIATCFVAAFNGVHLGHCWNILLERYPKYRDHIRDPYSAIAERAVGKWMRYVISFFLDVGTFAGSVIYLLLITENIHSLMAYTGLATSFCLWMIIVTGILLPLQWFGSPKDFWFLGVLSASSSVIYCILIVISLILQFPVAKSDTNTYPWSWTHVFLAFGVVIFSYGGAITFPTVQHDMKDPSKFSKVVALSFSATLCLTLPVGISGYLIYGNSIHANVIMSLPEGGLRMAIEILVIFHLLFTFGLLLNPLAQELDARFHIPKEFSIKRILLRSALVCGILFVGQTIPHFSALCSLVGGSSLTVLCFIAPSVFYIRLCQQSGDWPERVLPFYQKVVHGIIIVVGIFGGIAASYSSILEIVIPDIVMPCYINFTLVY